MNLLDENFPADQAAQLRQWRIPFRQIGRDSSRRGAQGPDILPILHHLKRALLFTQDEDFFKPRLCHSVYGPVWPDVKRGDAAFLVRRFLRRSALNTHVNRVGIVARAHRDGLQLWRRRRPGKLYLGWQN